MKKGSIIIAVLIFTVLLGAVYFVNLYGTKRASVEKPGEVQQDKGTTDDALENNGNTGTAEADNTADEPSTETADDNTADSNKEAVEDPADKNVQAQEDDKDLKTQSPEKSSQPQEPKSSTPAPAPEKPEKTEDEKYIESASFLLGSDLITTKYKHLIDGKRVGVVTNQTGLNSRGIHIADVIRNYSGAKLTALYAPEHGIDGKAPAGKYVESYTHPEYNVPVYSLYNNTRKPTSNMLKNIDVLIFDIQDVGARYYTYISTMNYCLQAAKENKKAFVVLDRPNPLGGLLVEGPVLEDKYKSFVGIDNLPVLHGMTIGEVAGFFNRNIGGSLTVVPMKGYRRDMIWQDTGLKWTATSPRIPELYNCFVYTATGLGEGITQIGMDDNFKWVGGAGLDGEAFADMLNNSGLPGVEFVREKIGTRDGVRLNVTDFRSFNPFKTGIYVLSYAKQLTDYPVPKSTNSIVMFEKIMGTALIGEKLEQKASPEEIISSYQASLESFRSERKKYLIYD